MKKLIYFSILVVFVFSMQQFSYSQNLLKTKPVTVLPADMTKKVITGPGTFSPMAITIQDFEGATFPPAGWTLVNSGTYAWLRVTTCSGFGVGTAACQANFYNNITAGSQFSITTPTLTASIAGDSLKFDEAYATTQARMISYSFLLQQMEEQHGLHLQH